MKIAYTVKKFKDHNELGLFYRNEQEGRNIAAEPIQMIRFKNCIIAVNGDPEYTEKIRLLQKEFRKAEKIDRKFLSTQFLPKLAGMVRGTDLAKTEENGLEHLTAAFYVLTLEKIFYIDSYYCVFEVPEYDSMGYGSDVIRILLSKNKDLSMKELYEEMISEMGNIYEFPYRECQIYKMKGKEKC